MNIIEYFHHLFNPHCPHCTAEKLQKIEQEEMDKEINKVCPTCEVLKIELAKAHNRIDKLQDKLIETPEPVIVNQEQSKQIIQTRRLLPSQIREHLETQSRLRAAELRANMTAEQNAAKPDEVIEKLEQEIKLDEVNAGN